MKSIFYLLILICFAISCSNKPDLEGLWQKTGDFDSLGNKMEMSEGVYFSFNEDSVVLMHLSWRRNDVDTLPYELTDSTLLIGETTYYFDYDDSLQLYYSDDYVPSSFSIFKKLGDDKKAKSLEKLNLDGFYALIRDNGDTLYHLEFFQDSLFQHDKDGCSDNPYGMWEISEINGFHFFDSHRFIAPLRIDSCFENKITLIGDYDAEWKFSLERYEPPPIREKFVGNWTITDAYALTDSSVNDINSAEIKSIKIEADSLSLNGEKSKLKWLLSFDERAILFPDINYYDNGAFWRLIEFSDYKLTIAIYADHNLETVLSFIKVPNESANPFAGHKQM